MTCWASRKFALALGGVVGIYKPLNYDATMLIRLTSEMKDAFLLVVRLVALYQAKKLGV